MKSQIAFRAGMWMTVALACQTVNAADSTHRYVVADNSAARAQLPFSDAVQAGDALYISGTLGLNPMDMQVPADPKVEARQVMEAIQKTLQAAGYQIDDLVSVQVYCTNLDLYGAFNEVYRGFFHDHFPARAFIGVNQLLRGAHFELMGIAVKHATGH